MLQLMIWWTICKQKYWNDSSFLRHLEIAMFLTHSSVFQSKIPCALVKFKSLSVQVPFKNNAHKSFPKVKTLGEGFFLKSVMRKETHTLITQVEWDKWLVDLCNNICNSIRALDFITQMHKSWKKTRHTHGK